jgi:uncharacterized glyoxalase superfamily protein PhnB
MDIQPTQSAMMANRSMPPGIIIPELVYEDLDAAVAWLCMAFGFQERLRIGDHRAQLVFGTAAIIVVARPAGAPDGLAKPRLADDHSLLVRVDDVDAHYQWTQQYGAQIISPPADFPYGERQYTTEDLAGRRWTFSQSIADVDPLSWGGRLIGLKG